MSQRVSEFERYEHHGQDVAVRSSLKGVHRDVCLCYDCKSFAPGEVSHCPIAKAVYDNAVKFDLVTPVLECPAFVEADLADRGKYRDENWASRVPKGILT